MSSIYFPICTSPDLSLALAQRSGTECVPTQWAMDIELRNISVCDVASVTVYDIWGLDMQGAGGQRAMVYNTTFPTELTITKLKDLHQYITALNLTSVIRRVPASANATCQAGMEVVGNTHLTYTPPNLYATVDILMGQAVVCEPPLRGQQRNVSLDFTYQYVSLCFPPSLWGLFVSTSLYFV